MQTMSDYLVTIGSNQVAKKVIKSLGLPIPLPVRLERGTGPWVEKPLTDRIVVVNAFSDESDVAILVREILKGAGATLKEKCNKGSTNIHALVYDATACRSVDDLTDLYRFFNESVNAIKPSGRVVIVGNDPKVIKDPGQAAVAASLTGFVKSLAKEVGRRGATVQLIQAAPTTHNRLAGPLRFFLGDRSTFVSGQVIPVSDLAKDVGPAPLTQPFAGKLALVTGAAQGIGRSIAATLAREGAKVICLDRPEEAEAIGALTTEIGGVPLLVDLLDHELVTTVRKAIRDNGGKLDILVNNAGITRDKTMAKMPKDNWTQTLDVNLGAVMTLTQGLLAEGLADHGRIICMASVNGIAGAVGQTNYSAAKAGVIGYVQALAPIAAERNITVNALAPGFIETKMTQAMPLAIREAGRRFNALSQGGQPDDVAEVAAFVASQGASGITGAVIRVCGLNLISINVEMEEAYRCNFTFWAQ